MTDRSTTLAGVALSSLALIGMYAWGSLSLGFVALAGLAGAEGTGTPGWVLIPGSIALAAPVATVALAIAGKTRAALAWASFYAVTGCYLYRHFFLARHFA